MTTEVTSLSETEISCENCQAFCCRLQVMLINDMGVPERFIEFLIPLMIILALQQHVKQRKLTKPSRFNLSAIHKPKPFYFHC